MKLIWTGTRTILRTSQAYFHLRFLSTEKENNHTGDAKPKRLLKELCQKIRFQGPMTLAQYMQEVLVNPVSGYYTNSGEIFGTKGDYITSPEISQMFGECLGIWIINEWHKMGRPKPLQLVEMGPGKGTLMRDVLKTFFTLLPKEARDVSVHLVDVSKSMIKIQEATLCGYYRQRHPTGREEGNSDYYHRAIGRQGNEVFWYGDLSQVRKGFSFFLAHEFFDALPIHQFVKVEGQWHEVLVDVTEDGERLRYVRSRERTPNCAHIDASEPRDEVEISPKTGLFVQEMCETITECGGAALITDYGHSGEKGNTFRAFKQHQLHDPLVDPGHADITADVDFSFIRKNCSETTLTYGPVEQGVFLHRMGIEVRKEKLVETCKDESIKKDLESSYQMLTDSNQMGSRFKFFSIFPKTMEPIHKEAPPAGFD